jgi:hypothetical protein
LDHPDSGPCNSQILRRASTIGRCVHSTARRGHPTDTAESVEDPTWMPGSCSLDGRRSWVTKTPKQSSSKKEPDALEQLENPEFYSYCLEEMTQLSLTQDGQKLTYYCANLRRWDSTDYPTFAMGIPSFLPTTVSGEARLRAGEFCTGWQKAEDRQSDGSI